jgi:N-acetyl-gamma-glutamyl-phosphate reductase
MPGRPFIEVQPLAEDADAQRLDPQALNGSNRLRLSVFAHGATGQVLLAAVFDNLGKGAAGAAVQNLELMLGLSAGPAVGATAHRRGNPAQCTVPGSIRSGATDEQRQARQ